MEINWIIIGIVAIGLIGLVVFLIKQNLKDKKELENTLNNDYMSLDEEEFDIDDDSKH